MKLKTRRISVVGCALALVVAWLVANPRSYDENLVQVENGEMTAGEDGGDESGENGEGGGDESGDGDTKLAVEVLEMLAVKGRAPKTGYSREEFYSGWPLVDGCNLRQKILRREFGETAVMDGCNVVAGEFDEPYTGQHLVFTERAQISSGVQIDHVVALSDAWQKGAQYLDKEQRFEIATDPLNLLAVDATTNQKKSDGDAATWLPPNKRFRCQYVARQVSVKYKYALWVTEAEKAAIARVLESCPNEQSVGLEF